MSGSGAAGAALLPPHGEGRAADPTQAGRACLPPCGLPQGPTCAALRLAAAAAIGAMQAKLLAEAEVLCLCDEEWGDDELAVLAAGLTPAAAPKLEQILLSDNCIGAAGAAALGIALASLPALTELDVSGNRMGDEGCAALSRAFAVGPAPLAILNLERNGLGAAAAAAVAALMLSSPVLREVNLSGNVLGDAGCAAIAACLPRATALRSLWLCHNGIGSTGAAALAAALQQNIARLTALFPDCSRLVDAGVEQSSPKPHSVGLTALFLAGNPLIGEEGGEHGMKLLRIACWPAGVRQDLY